MRRWRKRSREHSRQRRQSDFPTAADARAQSACGCIKEGGVVVSCRDIGENGCKPTATIDCKKAVQELNDVWVEGEISDNICRQVRRFMQLLAETCMI